MESLNVKLLVGDHFESFSVRDRRLVAIVPITTLLICLFTRAQISQSGLSVLTSALSIFCALLFGFFVPVIDHSRRVSEQIATINVTVGDSSEQKAIFSDQLRRLNLTQKLSKQLFANVAFSILLSLTATVGCVVLAMLPNYGVTNSSQSWAVVPLSSLIVCLTISFLQNLVTLLRRLYTSFLSEANLVESQPRLDLVSKIVASPASPFAESGQAISETESSS